MTFGTTLVCPCERHKGTWSNGGLAPLILSLSSSYAPKPLWTLWKGKKKSLVQCWESNKRSSDTQPVAYDSAIAITSSRLKKVASGEFCCDKDEGSGFIKMDFIPVKCNRSLNKLLFQVGEFRAKQNLKRKRKLAL
jgi:hypothetical protein